MFVTARSVGNKLEFKLLRLWKAVNVLRSIPFASRKILPLSLT